MDSSGGWFQPTARTEQHSLLHCSQAGRGKTSHRHLHTHPVPCQPRPSLNQVVTSSSKNRTKKWNLWIYEIFCHRDRADLCPVSIRKRTALCSKASLHGISRTLKQHYLIPMMRGLGSIVTIHKTFPHLATIGKSYIQGCKGNLNFFSKTILEMSKRQS